MEYLHMMSQDEQVWTRASYTEKPPVLVTSTSLLLPVLGSLSQKQSLYHQHTLMSRAFLPLWCPKHFPLLCSLPTSAHPRVFPNPNHLNHDQAQVLGGECRVPSVFVGCDIWAGRETSGLSSTRDLAEGGWEGITLCCANDLVSLTRSNGLVLPAEPRCMK